MKDVNFVQSGAGYWEPPMMTRSSNRVAFNFVHPIRCGSGETSSFGNTSLFCRQTYLEQSELPSLLRPMFIKDFLLATQLFNPNPSTSFWHTVQILLLSLSNIALSSTVAFLQFYSTKCFSDCQSRAFKTLSDHISSAKTLDQLFPPSF